MSLSEIMGKILSVEKKYVIFGIRSDNRNYTPGEELPLSANMIDELYDHDANTYPMLDGTSATGIGLMYWDGDEEDMESLADAIEFNRRIYGRHYKNMYVIAGYDYHDGDDDREKVIIGAEVVCKI